MKYPALLLLPPIFGFVSAQIEWAPCAVYCYPQSDQSVIDLQIAGACPPPEVVVQASGTYYTSTCTCYDYQITDGSFWSNCYTCVVPGLGNTYEATCLPQQPAPQPDASCAQKSDDISNACSTNSDISTAVKFLCGVTGELTGGNGLSGGAKSVFSKIKFLIPGLARAALNIVDVGCTLYSDYGKYGTQLVSKGCQVWNQIGGCPADNTTTETTQSLISGDVMTSTGIFTTVSIASGTPAPIQATISDVGPSTDSSAAAVTATSAPSVTGTASVIGSTPTSTTASGALRLFPTGWLVATVAIALAILA